MWKFLFTGKDGQSVSENADIALASGSAIESPSSRSENEGASVKVMKKGQAMRVIFFYPGEEGTYVDNAQVTLYENGIVHIRSNQEETTTHLQNCEILWNFEIDAEDRTNKVRLLKPKSTGTEARLGASATEEGDNLPPQGPGPSKSPELL